MKYFLLIIIAIVVLLITFMGRNLLLPKLSGSSRSTFYIKYDEELKKNIGLSVNIMNYEKDKPVFILINEPGSTVEQIVMSPENGWTKKIEFRMKGEKFSYSLHESWKEDDAIRCLLLEAGADRPQHYMIQKNVLEKIFIMTQERKIHLSWPEHKSNLEKKNWQGVLSTTS